MLSGNSYDGLSNYGVAAVSSCVLTGNLYDGLYSYQGETTVSNSVVDLVARTIQEAAAVIAANVTVSAQMPAQIAAELPLIVLLVTCTPPEEIPPPAPAAELPLIVLFTILRLP